MNDTKSRIHDALTVYHDYWKSYLKGDMETMAPFIADDFQVIGSTEGEVFLNKKETLDFYEATADQVAGKAKLRNRIIEERPIDGLTLISEISDLYILVENEWVFYSKVRVTSLLQKKEDGWKFVQQHGSVPDSKTEDGEQIAFKKIQQENVELRDAVKRRTAELENKNRELEIEAALERVRAIALSMNKPTDMLGVCRVISNQLTQFSVNDIRNVQTVIINESKGTYLNYQYFTAYDRMVTEETEPSKHPTVHEMVHTMQKSADSYFGGSLEGKKLEEFRKYREKENQFPDPILEKTDAIYYYFYSIGWGGLGVTTYKPLPSEGLDIFKRFRNVFELAYRRFLDIEKAQAQAREAQIEASLERVRSLALGMRNSDEVGDVTDGFFSEFNKLTLKLIGCSIVVIDEEKDLMELWRARSNVAVKPFDRSSFKRSMEILKKNKPDWFPKFYGSLKKRKNYLVEEMSGKRRTQFLNSIAEQYYYSEAEKSKLLEGMPEKIAAHFIFFKLGYLVLLTEQKLPHENLAIARRFVDLFDFAYTRFLDIKKAEVQARELQIELALEHIRSQVTAMRESSDLLDIVVMMQAEFNKLGHEAHYFWHMRWLPDKYEKALTNGEGTRIGNVLELPRGFHGLKTMLDWEETDEPSAVFALDPETAAVYIDKMIKLGRFQEIDHSAPGPDEVRAMGGLTFVMARTTHGEIGYTLPGEVPNPPEEDIATLVRFAGVFDLAYRRFEDLQSAERRNRETQIELALERVRARTMAMQKSEELAETAGLLFEQFEELVGLPEKSRTFISIIDKKSETAKVWMTLPDGKVRPGNHEVPLTKNYILKRVFNAWEKKEPIIIRDLKEKELSDYLQFLSTLPRVQSDKDLKKMIKNTPKRLVFSEASCAYGLIGVMTDAPLEVNTQAIFVRFAHVFEQTYRRFLDLENAERQNIIIQAENERKTMELEEARYMQLSMLPKEVPKLENLEIAVHMQTATEVGGDYYDFSFRDNGSVNIALGDATGHGLKAGIMVSAMKSIFTTNSTKMDIEEFFSAANSGIKSMHLQRMMMGFTMLNIHDHRFELINAGMPPVFLFRNKSKSVEEIQEHGVPVGAMSNIEFNAVGDSLRKGDVILLLTDGLPELQNPGKEMYGYERIKRNFQKIAGQEPKQIVEFLKNSAREWGKGEETEDDITFVIIKLK